MEKQYIQMASRGDKSSFLLGVKRGMPIGLGYISVSFTFGMMAVSGGLPVWLAIFISFSNLTSAGQFAGTNLILAGAGYFEIVLTTFIINIRYMLMSLSLSQKILPKIPLWQRLIFGFGITDETFSVASMEQGRLSNAYMMGLISMPIVGWTLGTAMGGLICSALPEIVGSAMGIALYCMFLAIVIPPAKKSRSVLAIVAISVGIHLVLTYIPFLHFIGKGYRVILATILGAGIGAAIYPYEEEETE